MSRRKRKANTAFQKVREQIDREFKYYSLEELTRLAESPDASNRLFAVEIMGKQDDDKDADKYFQLCRKLVGDPESEIRSQAMIYIGEEIDTKSEEVWEVIAQYGDSPDEDVRGSLACILLEHLLDFDFDKYFAKVKEEIRKGRYRFLDTLGSCWIEEPYQKKINNYIRHAKRGLNPEDWK